MAHRFVTDLRAGDRLEDEVFAVRSKDLRTTTQGGLYIHAVLVDRTGQLVARQWQASEETYKQMPDGGFMRFTGRVENYKGNLQFIIDGMRLADRESYDIADFLPATQRDIDEMWKRVVEILGSIKHPDLAALSQEFLADEELMAGFRSAPAAAVMHHAYIGGLLEHTLNVLELAVRVIPLYPKLSLDLVLLGVFLHDMGKLKELTHETTIGYSDEGQLVGHIAMAVVWIDRKTREVGAKRGAPFPDDLRTVLQHIVLSHHGKYEFGSPKLPATPEAVAIHYLDNLDAKVQMFLSEIEGDANPASHWTNFNRALETKVYKPSVTGVPAG